MEVRNNEPKITLDDLARMMAQGFAEVRDETGMRFAEMRDEINAKFAATDKRIGSLGVSLNHKIGQLDGKVEKYHHEALLSAQCAR